MPIGSGQCQTFEQTQQLVRASQISRGTRQGQSDTGRSRFDRCGERDAEIAKRLCKSRNEPSESQGLDIVIDVSK